MTREVIEAFQRVHRNHLGRPLRVTGILDPETEWALDFETLADDAQVIIRRAQEHLDLAEVPVGSNSDPLGLIRGWLLECGAHPGDPWCAAYGSHCIGTVRIAGALALGRHFPRLLAPFAPCGLYFPTDDKGHGHFEIVIGVGATETMSIGGNVGNKVRCVRRRRAPHVKYCQITQDLTGTCPGLVPSVPWAPGETR